MPSTNRKTAAAPARPTETKVRSIREAKQAAVPLAELTFAQRQQCELAEDLIMRGGHPDDVKALIETTFRHLWTRRFGTNEKARTEASECAKKWTPSRFEQLTKELPARPQAFEAPEGSTVADLARIRVRNNVEYHFAEFMKSALIEDIWLLNEIFQDHGSGFNLAESFDFQIARSGCYVRVPAKYKERIEAFVKILDDSGKADDAEESK